MCHRCYTVTDLLHVNHEHVCLPCIKRFHIAPRLNRLQQKTLIADCSCIHYSSMINSLSLVSFIRIYGFFVFRGIRYYTIGDLVFFDSPFKPVARLFFNHLLFWF
jgi:hypothetical protein